MLKIILISIFSILLVLITFLFYYRKIKYLKIVFKYSKKLNYLLKLNEEYYFPSIYNGKRKILFKVSSKKKLEHVSVDSVMFYYLDNNIDCIKEDIEITINNIKLYDEYINKINNYSYEIKDNINKKVFNKYENKLINKYIINNNFNISVIVKIKYVSKKKKNSYVKKIILDTDSLINIYNNWNTIKEYEMSALYERSKMSASLRYDILKRDNFRCKICGCGMEDGVKLHVDHIIPVSKGGKTVESNLQTLCELCNLGKSNKV